MSLQQNWGGFFGENEGVYSSVMFRWAGDDDNGRLSYVAKSDSKNFPGVARNGDGCLQITTTPGKTISAEGVGFIS